MDRRAIQKRIERLRRAAGGLPVTDERLIAYARLQLAELAGPVSRGIARLQSLGSDKARGFAQAAGLQALVIDDWIELARSPADQGWGREQIHVQELGARSVLGRGAVQSWLTEKKRYLRRCWEVAETDGNVRRNLIPNQLKMDLVELSAAGTEDAPLCSIRIAPVDWLSCYALNSRLDAPLPAGAPTIRDRWGDPKLTLERRGLPGMLVAHIVVETGDARLLVCQRQRAGIEDEPGTWSLSIEERWSGRLNEIRNRDNSLFQRKRASDAHPHDVVRRGIEEELGISVDDGGIRLLAWGIEQSVLYPGFIAIAHTELGASQIEGFRVQASDPNEIRLVSSVPAEVESIALLAAEEFAPPTRPELRARWHRSSRARLLTALAHIAGRRGEGGRQAVLARLGNS